MIKRIVAAAALLTALSACASPQFVVSDVTRFHTQGNGSSEAYAGKSFAVVAVSPEQEQSIAFRQIADQLNAHLTALGLHQFTGAAPTGADYVVTLDYDVLGPTPDVRTHGGNFGVGFGYSNFRRPWGYGFAYRDPFWDDYPYTDTRQMFARRVELMMYRGDTYTSGPKQRVFEARAISMGQNGQIEPVMPYMLDAVFKEFPGQNGHPSTVSVQVPESVEKADHQSRPSARSSY